MDLVETLLQVLADLEQRLAWAGGRGSQPVRPRLTAHVTPRVLSERQPCKYRFMRSRDQEIEDLRLDIATLRALIDVALDQGVSGRDYVLQGCANILYEKRRWLEQLENIEQADAAVG